MRNAKKGVERLKKVLLQDKTGAGEDVTAVIKSDAYDLLDSYFEVDEHSVRATVEVGEYGQYEITISARAYRVRGFGRSG